MQVQVLVTAELPKGASRTAFCDYVVDAVQSWCGQLRPAGGYGDSDVGDPMFYLDPESVKASWIRE